MVLNNFVGWRRAARVVLLGSLVCGAMTISACGSSEETAMEDEGFDDSGFTDQAANTEQQAPAEEPAKEENSEQQALTSFIGAAPKKEVAPPPAPPPQQQQAAVIKPAANPVDNLQIENTSLKQKVVKLEQDVRTLNARISDTETKYMSEKERADKAEEAAKVAAQSAMISARGSQVTMPDETAEFSTAGYDAALDAFNAKRYDDAITALQGMINSGVPKNLEDNCHYWIGESNFGKKNYQEAMSHFEMVFQYEGSEKLADAHFMIAQCLERTGNKAKAKEAYEQVVKDFPMSRLVQRAKERWARL